MTSQLHFKQLAEKYTELGKLRRQSAVLRARIIQTIETLLRSQDMKDKIADKYEEQTLYYYY